MITSQKGTLLQLYPVGPPGLAVVAYASHTACLHCFTHWTVSCSYCGQLDLVLSLSSVFLLRDSPGYCAPPEVLCSSK